MKIENPFWVVQNWLQEQCNQISWYVEGRTSGRFGAVEIAIGSMMIGILIVLIGVSIIEWWIFWLMGSFVFLPCVVYSDIKRVYKKNTKDGCKNAMQKDWVNLIVLNLFLLGLFIVCLAAYGDGVEVVRFGSGGLYVMVVFPCYFLATDPMPGHYDPSRWVRYA